jgi:hypothetical protein
MLFLLLSSVIIVLIFNGTGCLFSRILKLGPVRNPWLFLFLGIFFAGTLVLLGSLFFPVNLTSLIVFVILGGIGLPLWFREYTQSIRNNTTAIKLFGLIGFAFFFCLISLFSYFTYPAAAYDTDLYHAQTVLWYNTYGTAPGVGNLHARLAFNSLWLALAALIDNGIWDNRSEWIMPCLMLVGGVFYFLHELCFTKKRETRIYALCILAWLGRTAIKTVFAAKPNLYYDDSSQLINAVVVLEAYFLVILLRESCQQAGIKDKLSILLMLAAAAFTIKPIGAITVVFSGIFILLLFVRYKQPGSVAAWIKIFTPALLAFGIWVTKNIFLSGYLLFPLPMLALPFDWTMPFELVKDNYDAIVGSARMPGPNYQRSLDNGFLFWFRPWIIRQFRSKEFLLIIAIPFLLSCIFWILALCRKYSKIAFYFFLWSMLSIVYWFITAPDWRFGSVFFWVSLATALLFLAPEIPSFNLLIIWENKILKKVFLLFWIVGIIGGLGANIILPHYNLWSIGRMPSKQVKEYTVKALYPFTVWIPVDDEKDALTGNSPLPSAPHPPANLEMRNPNNLGSGFRYQD